MGRGGCTLPVMALDTHAAVKTLTDAGADEALAVAVVEVAREASTDATGELVHPGAPSTRRSRSSSPAWSGAWSRPASRSRPVVVAALRFLG